MAIKSAGQLATLCMLHFVELVQTGMRHSLSSGVIVCLRGHVHIQYVYVSALI